MFVGTLGGHLFFTGYFVSLMNNINFSIVCTVKNI